MKQAVCILATIFILADSTAALAGPKEEQLYNSILAATFTDEKSVFAEQLARLGTDDAKAKLLRILEDKSSWNREAAARGLVLFNDPGITRALFNRMLTDHMIDTAISGGLARNIDNHFAFLTGHYSKSLDKKPRESIIGIIGSARLPRGERFLKEIIDDENSPDRALALENLVRNYPANNYQYIRSRRDTVPLRFHALAYLADKGTAEDLSLFQGIIDRKEEARYLLIAFKAVNRLGDEPLKQRVFLKALGDSNNSVAQGAMYIFTGIRSDAIRTALCTIVKKSGSQLSRMTAVSRLREYTTPDIIPPLVMSLDERFIHHERGGGDIFATIITIGISSVFDDLYQKQRKKTFETSKQDIAAHLKRITGADNGTSYEKWSEWAIHNGYSINGANIIQQLFSGYKTTRDRAADSAIRLLGYSSTREFYARRGSFKSDSELSLALAGMLIEKGYLREELD